jgi:hypothetical protein
MRCSVDCNVVDLVVRCFTALAHLGLGAAGGWGFIQAGNKWALDNDGAVFIGIQSVHFCVFAVLGFLAELRLAWLVRRVLAPFGFLQSFMGRGIFCLYVGTVFLFIPWDPRNPWIGRVVGALEISAGSFQVLLSVFGGFAATPPPLPSSARSAGSEGSRIAWGKPSSEAVEPVSSSAVHVEGAHGRSMSVFEASSPLPAHDHAHAAQSQPPHHAGAEPPAAAAGDVITRNPFLGM